MSTPHHQLAEELVRRFVAAVRARQLYSPGHPIVTRGLESLSAAIQLLHSLAPSIVLGIVGDEVIVDDVPVATGESLGGFVRRLKQIAVERITVDRGVTRDELAVLIDAVATAPVVDRDAPPHVPALAHVRVGRVTVDRATETQAPDMAAFQRLYKEAVSLAEVLWRSASSEAAPDVTVARSLVDGLAQAVAENRTALLALATLRNYDHYTFTHMVNVSILTMSQARSLGIDGPLLREFGVAALLHDIGKVRTPPEILNKPDQLNDEEFAIMRRHPVDGAEILRGTPDMPTLAAVVAFEHHLRLDGTGYPTGVARRELNLATALCAIADVYDAMRSQRRYQQAFPSDRILEVLRRNDGRLFDQHLVRRFTQLVGIYPPGAIVRLESGDLAVVVKAHAPDPHRPQVRIVQRGSGEPVAPPRLVNLWEDQTAAAPMPGAIVAPVDPTGVGVDPLGLL